MRRRSFICLLVFCAVAGVLFLWPREPHTAPNSQLKPKLHRYEPPPLNLIVPPKPANGAVPTGWRPFRPPDSYILKPFVLEPSLAQRLPCIDQWVSQGKPCEATDHGRIDAVWTYINGSEPILDATRNQALMANTKSGPRPIRPLGFRSTHFRTHGEMVNSMRSVFKSLPAGYVNKVRGYI